MGLSLKLTRILLLAVKLVELCFGKPKEKSGPFDFPRFLTNSLLGLCRILHKSYLDGSEKSCGDPCL